MKAFEKLESQWQKQQQIGSIVLNRSQSKSILKNAEDYRMKVEERQLLDRGQDIREKFGDLRGWKMGLRYYESRDSLIEYSEQVGAFHSGIAYKIKEDIKKPVEIIRRNVKQSEQTQI